MMHALKLSIAVMTAGIVVLSALIVYKLFVDQSNTTSKDNQAIELRVTTSAPIVDFSIAEDEIAVMTQDDQLYIFDRDGTSTQVYTIIQSDKAE